jgi:hypothetical protein
MNKVITNFVKVSSCSFDKILFGDFRAILAVSRLPATQVTASACMQESFQAQDAAFKKNENDIRLRKRMLRLKYPISAGFCTVSPRNTPSFYLRF